MYGAVGENKVLWGVACGCNNVCCAVTELLGWSAAPMGAGARYSRYENNMHGTRAQVHMEPRYTM